MKFYHNAQRRAVLSIDERKRQENVAIPFFAAKILLIND